MTEIVVEGRIQEAGANADYIDAVHVATIVLLGVVRQNGKLTAEDVERTITMIMSDSPYQSLSKEELLVRIDIRLKAMQVEVSE